MERSGGGKMRVAAGACMAAACAAGLLGAGAGGACGAALVDIDAGDDAGRDVREAEDAPPPADVETGCGTIWYHDGDGDTYGDEASTVCEWTQPAGYVADGTDCCDAKADAHPGQTTYFVAPYSDCGSDSFDYDCSGVEEPQPAVTGGHCTGTAPPCDLVIGWVGASPPACGASAQFVTGCLGLCLASTANPTQACR